MQEHELPTWDDIAYVQLRVFSEPAFRDGMRPPNPGAPAVLGRNHTRVDKETRPMHETRIVVGERDMPVPIGVPTAEVGVVCSPTPAGLVLTCGEAACQHSFDPPAVFADGLSCPRCDGWLFWAALVAESVSAGRVS